MPELDERYGPKAAGKVRDFIFDEDNTNERWDPFEGQPRNDQ